MGKRIPCLLPLIIFLLSGCKKDSANQPTSPSSQNNLYISGTFGSGDTSQAVYWKNDSLVILPGDGLPTSAGNIVVSGKDVYVLGEKGRGAGYWKNGNFVTLNDTFFSTTSVAVSGDDIYLAATWPNGNHYAGGYYKNGQLYRISNNDSVNTDVTSIAVNGQNLLLGITEADGLKPSVAKYWLNGTAHNLSDGTRFAYVFGVSLIGNDIYAVGAEFDAARKYLTAKYWKNGIAYAVSDSTNRNIGTHIAVSGNDVYVAGYGHPGPISVFAYAAKYWKNGVETVITDGAYESHASWIEVSGPDVYVVFQEFTEGIYPVAKYLKNGKLVQLTDLSRRAIAFSSFVAPKVPN